MPSTSPAGSLPAVPAVIGGGGGPEGEPPITSDPPVEDIHPTNLSVPILELRRTVITPERTTQKIEITPKLLEEMSRTIAFHIDIINKTPAADRPDATTTFRGFFYAYFQKRFPEVKLDNAESVRFAVKEFLKEGVGIRTAFKLAEWEAATLQAASGRMFEKGKDLKTRELSTKTIMVMGPNGFEKKTVPLGFRDKYLGGSKVITGGEWGITGGNSINTSRMNTHLSDEQRHFLLGSGWKDGALSSEQIADLDERLYNIASLRTDLYRLTGLPTKDIELNFIAKDSNVGNILGRKYLTAKIAHFTGEGGSAGVNIRDILNDEGKAITQEIKDKVEKEITEKKKKAKDGKMQRTVDQLTRRIEEIKSNSSLSDAEKTVRFTEINAELERLKKQLELFSRQRLLPGEIIEATTAKDNAKKLVEDQNTMTVAGEVSVDLITWSADVSVSDSCAALQVEIADLEEIKRPFTEDIAEIDQQIKDHYEHKPAERLDKSTTKETKGGTTTVQIIEPDPLDKEIKQRWFDHLKSLQGRRETLKKQINENKTQDGNTETISGRLAILNAKLTRRQTVLADTNIKPLIDGYHESELTLKKKQEEEKAVQSEISPSGGTALIEVHIKDSLKKKEEEKKALEAGGLVGEDKLEVAALTALTEIYPSLKQAAREERTKEAEQTNPSLEYGPQWKEFPQAILRCVQLIWGDELLEAHPVNKDLADQLMMLMKSKKYLSVFIDGIESTPIPGVAWTAFADRGAATTNGSYDNLNAVFSTTAGNATINSITRDKITRETVEKIVESLRITALNIVAIP